MLNVCKHFFRLVLLLSIFTRLYGQNTEIERLIQSELKMTFPSIYFKHNSTDYASMPYTVDSCFEYIALHVKDINDLVIWRDSLETELLSMQRIKKLKAALSKHKETRNLHIESMDNEQKISRHTIEMGVGNKQIQYLLSLNSVFDIAKTRGSMLTKVGKGNHKIHPKIGCWGCWKSGFHIKYRREMRKSKRLNKKNNSSK